jgi:tyramine---L-glutamate ligase
MKIFVYEYLSGGGTWNRPVGDNDLSLLREGEAMVEAIAADFAAVDNTEVVVARDIRLPPLSLAAITMVHVASARDERHIFQHEAEKADWTLLISPETSNLLLERSRIVEAAGGRLLSPQPACIAITGDKNTTASLLASRGVPVPREIPTHGGKLHGPIRSDRVLVIKPVDGCGSQGVRLVTANDLLDRDWGDESAWRIEEYVPGIPASVAVLCGPNQCHALPACKQRLSADGRFTYQGGCVPLDADHNRRAARLALAAVKALPEPQGYLGVDLVLGEAVDGSGDRVIEINPRLTTSYIGLRAASRTYLAAAMLEVARGRPPDLCFADDLLEFTADGRILVAS